jgi:hypothetical protein
VVREANQLLDVRLYRAIQKDKTKKKKGIIDAESIFYSPEKGKKEIEPNYFLSMYLT